MNKIKKDMYHIHDKSYKDLYSKKEVAIDLLKNYVKKEFTKDLKAEDLTLVNKSFISSDYEETESDIVYKIKIGDTEAIFYILLEFQSRVDYRMPLRLLFYTVEILREFSKNENHKKTDKNIKIPAVIPIVLYNGKQVWDVPTEFRKMFYGEEKFHSGILNFTYDIFDINNGFTKEELLEQKNVTSAIFLLDQKITAIEFLNRIKEIALFFDGLSEEELKAIKHWIKNTTEDKLAKTATKVLESKREEVLTMVANNAFMLKELKEEGREEGIKLTKKIFKLSSSGKSLEEIAKECKMTVDEVKAIVE
ncbi:MAG: Rpn family recombination-promoting nuclease/putative transposase [Clostridium sp.]|uniref:Rpn family recombination-promoting nuclease/putative transposase n=1 Tax=Clostridium sp. TaxID=1506 RepID=UPI003EE538E4